tara:strand:+ start:311 stop:496 length:186 start_codon:yes stop_codon:yes gene_type:complete
MDFKTTFFVGKISLIMHLFQKEELFYLNERALVEQVQNNVVTILFEQYEFGMTDFYYLVTY